MTTTRKTPSTTPPPAAVANDAHWAAKRERLLARTRPMLRLTICDDPDAKQAVSDAQNDEKQARYLADRRPDDKAAQDAHQAAEAKLAEAQSALDAVSIVLSFQALDRKTYRALLAAHRPTEEQAGEGYDFNVDTLGPIMIAASSLDGITEEDAATFLDTWSENEAQALLNTAFRVQREERMDLGKG
ncbi:hypothetical protein [Streptomyces microflavus]|uniref:hypothetical protein n=1 Tax=Streptomyces microflavus TaxID=1919 RepID=UPI003B21DCF9